MAMDWLFMYSLLLSFAVFIPSLDGREIKEGVFIHPEGGEYKLNASTARDACMSQNAALATNDQMETALQHGLQTCKYGWIDEQIAIIPRIVADPKCGKGKTGLVTWKAQLKTQFAAYCFQAPDVKQPLTMTTDSVLTFKLTTALPVEAHASTAVTPSDRTKMKPPASVTTTAAPALKLAPVTSTPPPTPPVRTKTNPPASVTSTAPPGRKLAPLTSTSPPTLTSRPSTARSSSISPTPLTKTFASSTTAPSLLSSLLLTSITARFSSSPSSPSSSLSPFTSPSPPVTHNHTRGSATLETVASADTPLGGVPRALIVIAVILLLLTVAGTAFYFQLKKRVFPSWSRRQQKDDTETEMWKHTDSDLDLHGNQAAEEEADKENSDDATACLNSDNTLHNSSLVQ